MVVIILFMEIELLRFIIFSVVDLIGLVIFVMFVMFFCSLVVKRFVFCEFVVLGNLNN